MRLAILYKQLSANDFKVLSALEKGLREHEYVPVEIIVGRTRLPEHQAYLSLGKLNRLKLIKRYTGRYVGYKLTFRGLDCLALRSLVSRGIIEALGDKLGVGKESDVYLALTPTGIRATLKLMRVGRTSFKQTKRVRTYVEGGSSSWLIQAKIAGEREYKALEELHRLGAMVPKPLGWSRHAVVTEYLEGLELYKIRSLSDPEAALTMILETMRIAYLKAGIVHGDLSEYNILVTPEEKAYIIDWPQYVYRDHPSAERLLRRDVDYVVKFFRRRFKIQVSELDALRYVKGETNGIRRS